MEVVGEMEQWHVGRGTSSQYQSNLQQLPKQAVSGGKDLGILQQHESTCGEAPAAQVNRDALEAGPKVLCAIPRVSPGSKSEQSCALSRLYPGAGIIPRIKITGWFTGAGGWRLARTREVHNYGGTLRSEVWEGIRTRVPPNVPDKSLIGPLGIPEESVPHTTVADRLYNMDGTRLLLRFATVFVH
ncbi:hypothetical protein Bbelb_139610 [Branchiostoma belcheri]|nr:hypothetical protein Bbelb_139610 [Branchiostoma belcheri]